MRMDLVTYKRNSGWVSKIQENHMIALCMLSFCNLHVSWHGFPSQVFWCIVVCSQISVLSNNYSRCNQLSLNTLNSLGFVFLF
jgi:hypothetical protein